MYDNPKATARQRHTYPSNSKIRTESATTHVASVYLLAEQPTQIVQPENAFRMVVVEGFLRDFYRTTAERLGILIFALRLDNATTGSPWFILIDDPY